MKMQNSGVSFTGVKFPYRVDVKNLENLRNFLSDENNINLIKKLDLSHTDIYFTNGVEKVGFTHQYYGDLNKYGAPNVFATDFAKDGDIIFQKVYKAVKKVRQILSGQTKNARGC